MDWDLSREEFFEGLEREEDIIKAIEIYHWKDHFPSGAFKRDLLPFCPHCRSKDVHRLKTRTHPRRFQCNECRKQFNVFTKTPFYRSKTDLVLWFHVDWHKKNEKTIDEISTHFNKRKRDIESILDKLKAKDKEIEGSYINQIRLDYLNYKSVWGTRKLAHTNYNW